MSIHAFDVESHFVSLSGLSHFNSYKML